jgi:DNA-binding NarL/FixJ family response regulator
MLAPEVPTGMDRAQQQSETHEDQKIRVLCVEDDEATASFYRISLNLEPDMQHVGNRSSTEGLLEAVRAARPTVVLLDFRIHGSDSLAALSELRAQFPTLVVIVVSGMDDPKVVDEAFARGASAFFLKGIDLERLPQTIRRAAAGERFNSRPEPRGLREL